MISNETRDLFFILHGHVIHLIASISGYVISSWPGLLKVKICIDRKSFAEVRTLERMGGPGKGAMAGAGKRFGPHCTPHWNCCH